MTGPYRAEFGAVHHEAATGFLFTVSGSAENAQVVARALNQIEALKAGLIARKIDIQSTSAVNAALVAISHYQAEREGNPLASVPSVETQDIVQAILGIMHPTDVPPPMAKDRARAAAAQVLAILAARS